MSDYEPDEELKAAALLIGISLLGVLVLLFALGLVIGRWVL